MVTPSRANPAHPGISRLSRLKNLIGLDGAIAYTFFARSLQVLGSVGTVLLIVRFMTPAEQGYYYALYSLAALQVIFELGFSTVILQMAAHEHVHLTPRPDGSLDTASAAYGRLASVFQKTVRWYLIAGLVMLLTLLPAGGLFFHRLAGTAHGVAWQRPWQWTAIASVGGFVLNPLYSFLEGCGQIRQVARMRLIQVLAGVLFGWTAMMAHHGLYSPALVMAAASLIGLPMLWSRRCLLTPLLLLRCGEQKVQWRTEVWPFQWKIAITSLCTYFTSQIFTLILFTFRSPQEAGQMGMSLSITFYLNSLVGPWMSTKAPRFGGMAAQKRFTELDRLFFRTLRQSVWVLAAISAIWEAGIIALSHLAPKLSARMVSPAVFALLFLTIISTHVAISEGTYLRAFKREPFLYQSIFVALLTLTACLLTAKPWGATGIAVSYFISNGVVGLIAASFIFCTLRKKNLNFATMPVSGLDPKKTGMRIIHRAERGLVQLSSLGLSRVGMERTSLERNRDVVVLADFRATAWEHCQINLFFLRFYRLTLGKKVHLYAEKEHVDFLTRSVPVDFAQRFSKTYSRKRILVVFLREIMSLPRLLGVILHARRHHAELLHILFLSHFAHLAARILLSVIPPGCPVLITMHGELEALARNERRFWKADYWLPRALRLATDGVYPILLGRNIMSTMQTLGFDKDRFVEIEHPYSFGIARPQGTPNRAARQPLRVGSIGLASLTKGSDLLFTLANKFLPEIAGEKISFRHVGRLHPNMSGHTGSHVKTLSDGGFATEAEYETHIQDLDVVLFFYPRHGYSLTASGALFDVIRHNKRMITFPNAYFRWVLRTAPAEIALFVDNLDQMESILRGWLVSLPPLPEGDPYAAVRHEHSIETVESAFLDQLNRKIGSRILTPRPDRAEVLG